MIRDTAATDRLLAPPSRTRRRLLIASVMAAATLAMIAAVARWASAEHSVDGSRVRIAEVTRGTLVRDATVNGRVVAAISPTLYAAAAGTLTLQIHAGDSVEEGQLLARIDSPELDNELKREQSTLEQLQSEVARQRILAQKARLLAQRDADEADVARTGAARDLQSTQRGFDLGALPQIDLLKAQDTLRSAEIRAAHAGNAATLEAREVELALKTSQQQLERQRLVVANVGRRVDELNVRAPVAGVVGTLAVADRAVVPANTALMTLVDLSRLEVELEVPETYADEIGLGMTAEVSIGNERASGKVSALSPEVVNHQVLARVRFEGSQPNGLRQNQRVSARVLIDERPDVLMVARGPFVEQQGGRFAYVMDGDTAVRRPIVLGATSVSAVEIRDGLGVGDRVVIAGSDAFEDAARVRINE
ncbi:MAG: efflux transporter periplasmic adaptor subunit [Betaproteobacteria bacterium HGW-Betaproteobacteria-13]|jgi:HlyD family secretion protein|nr:MAG: efflux transporter periplasmic adaptor subunit [Betaproteobacteria bacterium HGW-Betaproteobacteria-13]